MATPAPVILLSATSSDLRSHRSEARRILAAAGYQVEEQDTSTGPDYRTSERLLREKVSRCDAVIHLAGLCHGPEPQDLPDGATRLSYTQMEYHLAWEMKKPCYAFLLAEDFHYDPHMPEDPEKRWLQTEHRRLIDSRPEYRELIADSGRLAERLRHTSFRLQEVRGLLGGARRRSRLLVAAVVIVACGIAALAWEYWKRLG